MKIPVSTTHTKNFVSLTFAGPLSYFSAIELCQTLIDQGLRVVIWEQDRDKSFTLCCEKLGSYRHDAQISI